MVLKRDLAPLKQITRENVRTLRLAWVWTIRDGSNESTPLVHDGVMYLINPRNVVQAIAAASGPIIADGVAHPW